MRQWNLREVCALLQAVQARGNARVLMRSTNRKLDAMWRRVNSYLYIALKVKNKSIVQLKKKWKLLRQRFYVLKEREVIPDNDTCWYYLAHELWEAAGKPSAGERLTKQHRRRSPATSEVVPAASEPVEGGQSDTESVIVIESDEPGEAAVVERVEVKQEAGASPPRRRRLRRCTGHCRCYSRLTREVRSLRKENAGILERLDKIQSLLDAQQQTVNLVLEPVVAVGDGAVAHSSASPPQLPTVPAASLGETGHPS